MRAKPKKKLPPAPLPVQRRSWFSIIAISLGIVLGGAIVGIAAFESKILLYQAKHSPPPDLPVAASVAFPVSVHPLAKEIVENPDAEAYLERHLSLQSPRNPLGSALLGKFFSTLALFSWYQNLATPSLRTLVIEPGERREQVVNNFGKILNWDAGTKEAFVAEVISSRPEITEGMFYPGVYVVPRGATHAEVVPLLQDRFNTEVGANYSKEVEEIVPLKDALTIASLLEREAYDFEDMRQISGVIWNRLFAGMNLQIDASLQYAKGSSSTVAWWPRVHPRDKYIDSPYNTYEHAGLPPAPIANPSLDAILAALNPKKTPCMFYFHDRNGGFHCTETYTEHVALLKQYYGRGK
jgi:cell division protein YceG involved in septum cleavage